MSTVLPPQAKRFLRKLRYMGALPGGSSKRVAYLHLGAHKTGTSSLQRAIQLNEKRLKKMGIATLHGRDRLLGKNQKISFFATPEFEQRLTDMLDTPGKREVTHSVLFSFEGALLTMNWGSGPGPYPAFEECLEMLHRAFSPFYDEIRVYYSIRNQAEFCESYYNQKIYEGSIPNLKEYLAKLKSRDVSWVPQIKAMMEIYGAENLEITDYSARKSLPSLAEFIDWSLVPEDQLMRNTSYDERQYSLAKLVLPKLKNLEEKLAFRKFLLDKLTHEDSVRPALLNADDRAYFDAQYQHDLAELAMLPIQIRR